MRNGRVLGAGAKFAFLDDGDEDVVGCHEMAKFGEGVPYAVDVELEDVDDGRGGGAWVRVDASSDEEDGDEDERGRSCWPRPTPWRKPTWEG